MVTAKRSAVFLIGVAIWTSCDSSQGGPPGSGTLEISNPTLVECEYRNGEFTGEIRVGFEPLRLPASIRSRLEQGRLQVNGFSERFFSAKGELESDYLAVAQPKPSWPFDALLLVSAKMDSLPAQIRLTNAELAFTRMPSVLEVGSYDELEGREVSTPFGTSEVADATLTDARLQIKIHHEFGSAQAPVTAIGVSNSSVEVSGGEPIPPSEFGGAGPSSDFRQTLTFDDIDPGPIRLVLDGWTFLIREDLSVAVSGCQS
jgi:hypothetical protein